MGPIWSLARPLRCQKQVQSRPPEALGRHRSSKIGHREGNMSLMRPNHPNPRRILAFCTSKSPFVEAPMGPIWSWARPLRGQKRVQSSSWEALGRHRSRMIGRQKRNTTLVGQAVLIPIDSGIFQLQIACSRAPSELLGDLTCHLKGLR